MTETFSMFLPIAKVDKERRQVSGYASTPALDLDGEIVSLDAIKKALPGYMSWRNIREMHSPSAVGVAKEAHTDDAGLFLTAKIVDEIAWQKCLEGVYKGFSIGGRKLAKNGNTITDIELIEISVVDRPANPECRFEVQKSMKAGADAVLVKAKGTKVGPKKLEILSKVVDLSVGITEFLKFDGSVQAEKPEPKLTDDEPIIKAVLCKAHGVATCDKCTCAKHATVDCEKCAMKMAKREVKRKERTSLAGQGDALPDGSFPIKNKGDLANARQAVGRSKNPGAARALIRRRARELGVELPDSWSKKHARSLIKSAEIKTLVLDPDSAGPSFLTLAAEDSPPGVEGRGKSGHELAKGFRAEPQEGGDFLDLNGAVSTISTLLTEGTLDMEDNTELGTIIAEALAKAGKPNPFVAGKANMKKAREMRKAAAGAVADVHKMMQKSYLAKEAQADLIKAGKKPEAHVPDADGDFDFPGAMQKLQKAFGALNTMKTFQKAASQNFAKAARPGQSGQEVTDGNEFYQVPAGVKTAPDLDTVGPGGGATGSSPPEQLIDQLFPGKSSKATFTKAELAMALKLVAAEAKADALEKMPAAPVHGKRPAMFDTSDIFGKAADKDELALQMDGVDPRTLASDDEDVRKNAVGRMIGNKILKGMGKSVFDPDFHGAGAGGQTLNG